MFFSLGVVADLLAACRNYCFVAQRLVYESINQSREGSRDHEFGEKKILWRINGL